MDNNSYTKQEYIDVLKSIVDDVNIDKDDIIKKLHALIDADPTASMAKCPNITNEELEAEMKSIASDFEKFVKFEDSNLTEDKLDINQRNLAEVVTRKFKRKEYFKFFHNMKNISELKEVSLLCFWIIKLKPFTILDDKSPLRVSINEKFSFNLILSTIKYLLDKQGKDFKEPDKSFMQDIIYSFKYRDISKEAMMMLVDSIAYSYGISIDTWK